MRLSPLTDLVLAAMAKDRNAWVYTTDPHFDLIPDLKRILACHGDLVDASAVDPLLDSDYHAEGAADTSPDVILAGVRAGLATIAGDMTADFAAERDEADR